MESPENDFCWSNNGVINVNETQKKTEVEYFSIIAADRNVFEELKKGNVHFQQIEYCTLYCIVLSNIFTLQDRYRDSQLPNRTGFLLLSSHSLSQVSDHNEFKWNEAIKEKNCEVNLVLT